MAAAAGSATGEAMVRALLQRHQPFVPPPGEYHNFGAPTDTGEEVVEAVVLRHRFPFPG
jgi:transcription factor E2F3